MRGGGRALRWSRCLGAAHLQQGSCLFSAPLRAFGTCPRLRQARSAALHSATLLRACRPLGGH
eukprot:1741637-Pyramimonas_sp.AAC.1